MNYIYLGLKQILGLCILGFCVCFFFVELATLGEHKESFKISLGVSLLLGLASFGVKLIVE